MFITWFLHKAGSADMPIATKLVHLPERVATVAPAKALVALIRTPAPKANTVKLNAIVLFAMVCLNFPSNNSYYSTKTYITPTHPNNSPLLGEKMEASKAFGLAVRKLRIAKDLTQEELGFESGLTRAYISSIELDQKLPSITTIAKLAQALELSLSELMGFVDKEMKK